MGRYRPDPDAVAAQLREAEERKKSSYGNDERGELKEAFIKLETGTSFFRALPTFRKDDHPKVGAYPIVKTVRHGFIPPDKVAIDCVEKMFPESAKRGIECELCKEIRALLAEGYIASDKEVGGSYITILYKMNVLVTNADGEFSRPLLPKILEMSPTVNDKYIQTAYEWSSLKRPIYVDDPIEGYNFSVKKTGVKKETRYEFKFDPRPTPISEDPAEIEKMLTLQWDLDRINKFPKDEKLAEYANIALKFGQFMRSYKGAPERQAPAAEKAAQRREIQGHKAPPTSPSLVSIGKGAVGLGAPEKACFGNWKNGLDFCVECSIEDDCKDRFKKMGPATKRPTPEQVAALEAEADEAY